MQQQTNILVAGSTAFDHLYTYEGSFLDGIDTSKLSELSVSFPVTNHRIFPGGAGANVTWNLGLLQQHVQLLSATGDDAQAYIATLKERGINVDTISIIQPGDTPHAVITTDDAKRQITLFDPGIEPKADWTKNLQQAMNVSVAILTPWRPSFMQPVIDWCKSHKVPYIFDPGQQILNFDQESLHTIVSQAAGVVLNEYEWTLLQQRMGLDTVSILNMTPFCAVTKGAEGFSLYTHQSMQSFPACKPRTTLNPTGAGDAFRAGMLTGIQRAWPLETGCQLGAALASLVVEHEEAQIAFADTTELMRRMNAAYGTSAAL